MAGGRLTIQMRDRDVVLAPGELFVVPQAVEHCPRAEAETAASPVHGINGDTMMAWR
jgi:mannose-6-phosphate isomerase-like protein (cupin superfamily)